MGQLYEFEQGLRLEAEARRKDTKELEMREVVTMRTEGICKPSLVAGAASWLLVASSSNGVWVSD